MFVPRFIGIRVLFLFYLLQFFWALKVWLSFPIFGILLTKKIQNFPQCFFTTVQKLIKEKEKKNKQTNKH